MNGSDFLGLDPSTAPLRGRTTWLADQLRAAISSGVLATGVRLPATRELAADLHLSRGTVVEAYRRLTEEGLLTANAGGGTAVADAVATSARRAAQPSAGADTASVAAPLVNISEGVPDITAFPRSAWLRAEREVLATATAHDLGYADPQGTPQLRQALARWVGRSRGIDVDADQIIVTAGVTGALSLIAQTLQARGIGGCAVEDPGAQGNRRILAYWLDELYPVPVDAHGIQVDALAATNATAVLVTPAHQFPAGVILAPTRRRELVSWAAQRQGYIIEDDYDSEYRYDRAPVRAMQPLAPGRVIHVSSLSKMLAPSLRIGWLIAPPELHHDLVRRRWATDLGSPVVPQLALARLIDTGVLERHLRTLRLRHRERRDAAVAAIARYLPGSRIHGIAAGLHLAVELPAHVDDVALAAQARAAGIAVQPLSALRFSPGRPGIVIGYGPHPVARLETAISRLGGLVAAQRPSSLADGKSESDR